MADPIKYTPAYDFSNFQASSPNAPLPGNRMDIELQNIDEAIEQTIEALKDIRRADGKLQNGSVSIDSLDATVSAGFADQVITALGPQAEEAIQEALPQWQGAWLTATDYAVNDLAQESGSTYICLVAHTSNVFATDLGVGRWALFAERGAPGATGAGSGDMLASNNLSDVADIPTARDNLGAALVTRQIATGTGLTGGGDLSADRTIAIAFASQAEAVAGIENEKLMTPLRAKQALNAAGDAPVFAARAFGYVSINLSTGAVIGSPGGNVASVSQISTGYYQVTFSVPLAAADYTIVASASDGAANVNVSTSFKNTAGFRVNTYLGSTGAVTRAGFGFVVL